LLLLSGAAGADDASKQAKNNFLSPSAYPAYFYHHCYIVTISLRASIRVEIVAGRAPTSNA
jgi:hypothetical protein